MIQIVTFLDNHQILLGNYEINQFQGFDSHKGENAEVMPHNYASGNQIRVPDLQGPIIDHKSGDANMSTSVGEH